MVKCRIGVWCLSLGCAFLAPCLSVATASPDATPAGEVLHIRIPQEIDPDRLTLLGGLYGNGLSLGPLDTKSGSRDCEIVLRHARSVKLLIYCPGYRMVTAEFDTTEISGSETFTPGFVRIPMVPLRIRLVDTKGRPLAGEEVVLEHTLLEMDYFNYLDGRVHPAVVATATTDAQGEIDIEVPSLLDDPYFSKGTGWGPIGFEARLPQRRSEAYGYDVVPRIIPAQRSYPEPVTATLVYRGMLSGCVADSFVRHALSEGGDGEGASGRTYSVWVHTQRQGERGGMGRRADADGTFSMKLPAGSYDLFVEIRRDGGPLLRRVPIRTGFVLEEKRNQVLRLE